MTDSEARAVTRCEGPSCKNDGTIPCAVSSTLRLEGEACDAKLCERCAETAHGLCESCLLIERAEAHCYA